MNHIRYDSFGRIVSEINPATNAAAMVGRLQSGDILNGFTGREYDPDMGLSWYLVRWYDPAAGRLLSEDPPGLRRR